jgi:hypothetical protein
VGVNLTAGFITDDAKPKDNNMIIWYDVEAFFNRGEKPSFETQQVKVVAGRQAPRRSC